MIIDYSMLHALEFYDYGTDLLQLIEAKQLGETLQIFYNAIVDYVIKITSHCYKKKKLSPIDLQIDSVPVILCEIKKTKLPGQKTD